MPNDPDRPRARDGSNDAYRPSHLSNNTSDESLEVKQSLYEALEIMRRGKWLILGVTLLVFGAAAGLTFLLPPEYSSATIVVVDTENQPATQGDLPEGPSEDEPSVERNLDAQQMMLQRSLVIANRVAEQLRDMETLPNSDETLPVLERWQQDETHSSFGKFLQEKYIHVDKLSERAYALQITAVGPDPQEAALISNLYGEEYVNRTRELNRRQLTTSRDFLEQQIMQRKAELDSLENQLSQYMEQADATNMETKTENVVGRIAELEAQLDEARSRRDMNRAALQSIQEQLEEIQPQLAEQVASGVQQQLHQKQEQIAQLQTRLEQIYQQNPEYRENPEQSQTVVDIQNRIGNLENDIRELSNQYVDQTAAMGSAESEEDGGIGYLAKLKQQEAEARVAISGAQAEIQTVQQRLAEYRSEMDEIPEQTVELAALRREHQSTEEMYNRLVDRLQEIRIAQESTTAYASIIRPADVPETADNRNVPKNMASGLILGLMLGIAAAFARYSFDSRIHTPDHLRRPGYNILGVVPDMRTVKLPAADEASNTSRKDGAVIVRNGKAPVASHLSPNSPVAEAYRRLGLGLQFSQPDRPIQSILITSPEAGAGKSTTTLNLGITLARTGSRTLVIDTDLRKPSLHKYIDQPNAPSIVDLLKENTPDLDPRRFETDVENLHALTTSGPIPEAVDLLSSRNMRELIQKMKTVYDVIIFDSPPILLATDGAYLSQHCDSTVVVASAASTDKQALEQTMAELRDIGANIAGIVLNEFDANNTFGYNATYKYRYDYGYHEYYGEQTE